MKLLKFSNAEVKKIVDTITKGKAWSYKVSSIDNKIKWEIKNNPAKSKIDVYADSFVDDYPYDLSETDDVYAAVVNVLDYLTNIVNKYNKRNPGTVKEDAEAKDDLEFFQDRVAKSLKIPVGATDVVEAMSKGMIRAYSKKIKEVDVHYTCKSCDTNIPKYSGKYPTKCPNCGESLKVMKEFDQDEAIWGGPFKRGTKVTVKLNDPDDFYEATPVMYDAGTNTYAVEVLDGDDKGRVIQGISAQNMKQ